MGDIPPLPHFGKNGVRYGKTNRIWQILVTFLGICPHYLKKMEGYIPPPPHFGKNGGRYGKNGGGGDFPPF